MSLKHRPSSLSALRQRPGLLVRGVGGIAIIGLAVLASLSNGSPASSVGGVESPTLHLKPGNFLFDLVHDRAARYVKTRPQLAAPASTIPEPCFVAPAMHQHLDRDCYLKMAALHEAELKADALSPYCYGRSDGSQPLLFHTLSMDQVPVSLQLLTNSFLATQCCDATLFIWLTPAAKLMMDQNKTEPSIPPEHAHRIVFKELSVEAEWASLAADFPEVNATAAAAMLDFADIRFRANWARLLLLYK